MTQKYITHKSLPVKRTICRTPHSMEIECEPRTSIKGFQIILKCSTLFDNGGKVVECLTSVNVSQGLFKLHTRRSCAKVPILDVVQRQRIFPLGSLVSLKGKK